MAKRDIFGELMEGVAAMKSHHEAKLTLRSYKVGTGAARQRGFQAHQGHSKEAALLQGCIPRKLRINERALGQAAALILLVRRDP